MSKFKPNIKAEDEIPSVTYRRLLISAAEDFRQNLFRQIKEVDQQIARLTVENADLTDIIMAVDAIVQTDRTYIPRVDLLYKYSRVIAMIAAKNGVEI